MTFNDWNKDGKIDIMDDHIECALFDECTNNNINTNRSNGKMSTFDAGCGTVISIVIAIGILSLFKLEGAALGIAFIIVVSIVAAVVSTFFE